MVDVVFLARLGVCNRVTVPVEVRWRFRLESGTPYAVRARGVYGSRFYARLQRSGQLTVPPEIVADEKLKVGDIIEVTIEVEE
jgi:bifunctional DNA-binding transcriptional regulator/antitoxin component of YhaV-PrlF toxin-antitoxin module